MRFYPGSKLALTIENAQFRCARFEILNCVYVRYRLSGYRRRIRNLKIVRIESSCNVNSADVYVAGYEISHRPIFIDGLNTVQVAPMTTLGSDTPYVTTCPH